MESKRHRYSPLILLLFAFCFNGRSFCQGVQEDTEISDALKRSLWEAEQQENFKQYYGTGDEGADLDIHDAIVFAPPKEPEPEMKREIGRPDSLKIFLEPVDSVQYDSLVNQPKMTIWGYPVFDTLPGVNATLQDKDKWQKQFDRWKKTQVPKGQYSQKRSLERAGEPTPGRRYSPRLEIRELDIRDSTEANIFANSRGVLGMILDTRVNSLGEEKMQVDTSFKLGPTYGLCNDEEYWNEPSACYCTAFLVAPDIVVTAQHCISQVPLERIRLILGFELADKNAVPDYVIKEREVFTPVEIVGGSDGQTLDFVMLRLDHKAVLQPSLPLASLSPNIGDSVYAIGYPSGLPMKVAGIGLITKLDGKVYSYSNLHTYEGNSGSPVFNSRTHEVVGILIEGDQDFENRGNCRKAKECYGRSCKGEKAISAVQIRPFLENAMQSR